MTNPILYDVLLTFEKAELRRFAKFVRSPFFTHRQELERMFSILATCQYRGKPLPTKEQLFKKTFPDRSYDDLLLRATMSDLKELMEEYLLRERMRSDEVRAKLALAAEYRERSLGKPFHKTMKKVESRLETSKVRNADHLAQVLDFQLGQLHFQTRTMRTGELPLQVISNSLDTLYLAQKLRHACTQLSHQAVFKTKYDFGLLPNVIAEVEKGDYLKEAAVALYYYCYRFMTEQYSHEFFQKFRSVLKQNGHLFPASELKTLYLFAINFCIRKLNEGDEPFIQEGWELYQEGLEQGFLLEHGRLSGFTFNNVAAFGIKLKAFAAVEAFIKKYQSSLEPTQQESFVHFNLARLEYTRQNHDLALRLLQTADFKDLVNNLIAKTLLMKIYYELEEYDLLDSHLDSLRGFIRRREVSDYHRQNYNNIISMVKKLMSLPPRNQAAKVALRKEIEQVKVLTEREWLLEQVQ